MKNTKLITGLIAIVTAVMLFTGCSNSYTTVGDVNTETSIGYKMGEQIWVVYCDASGHHIRAAIVVAEEGEYVIAANPEMYNGGDSNAMLTALVNSSVDGVECLNLFPSKDCYKTPEEAYEAAGMEPLG